MRAAAEQAGRDPASVKICVAAPAYVGDDLDHQRDQCRWFGGMVGNHVADIVARYGADGASVPAGADRLHRRPARATTTTSTGGPGNTHADFVPDEIVDRFCILGPAEAHVERLAELKELGVDQFAVYLQHDAKEETLRRLRRDDHPGAAGRDPRQDLSAAPTRPGSRNEGMTDTPAPARRARPGQALVLTATVAMALIALQFVLAGYGIFERQYHRADDGWFEPHQAVGYLTILATIAVLVVAVMTRRSRSVKVRAGAVVVLAVLQPLLAGLGTDTNPWWGVLHALDAVVIAGITGSLIGSGVRANALP